MQVLVAKLVFKFRIFENITSEEKEAHHKADVQKTRMGEEEKVIGNSCISKNPRRMQKLLCASLVINLDIAVTKKYETHLSGYCCKGHSSSWLYSPVISFKTIIIVFIIIFLMT